MLSRISGILGPYPENVLRTGRDTSKYFTLSHIVYERDEVGNFHLIFPKKTSLKMRLHCDGVNWKLGKDEELFVDFVKQTLHLDPQKRPTAYEALQHPWLADADTIEFEPYIIGQPAGASQQPDTNGLPTNSGNSFYFLQNGLYPNIQAGLEDDEEEEEDDGEEEEEEEEFDFEDDLADLEDQEEEELEYVIGSEEVIQNTVRHESITDSIDFDAVETEQLLGALAAALPEINPVTIDSKSDASSS
jgi:serine/threonine protein kinase